MLEECAHHEAGHAIVAISLGARVHFLTIDPDRYENPGRDGDIEIHWPRDRFTPKQLCEVAIQVALAGPAAEMIHTGDPFHPALVKEWESDWSIAWDLAASLHPTDHKRMAFLEATTRQLHQFLSNDRIWNALAALVDELLAHESLDGDEVHEIVACWL